LIHTNIRLELNYIESGGKIMKVRNYFSRLSAKITTSQMPYMSKYVG